MCNVWDDMEDRLPTFYEFLESIKSYSLPMLEGEEYRVPVMDGPYVYNPKYIYFDNYKFHRFDEDLIRHIEEEFIHKRLESFFAISTLDIRFTDPKYYIIKSCIYTHRYKFFYYEDIMIDYRKIIDDLYYKSYVYPTSEKSVRIEKNDSINTENDMV